MLNKIAAYGLTRGSAGARLDLKSLERHLVGGLTSGSVKRAAGRVDQNAHGKGGLPVRGGWSFALRQADGGAVARRGDVEGPGRAVRRVRVGLPTRGRIGDRGHERTGRLVLTVGGHRRQVGEGRR